MTKSSRQLLPPDAPKWMLNNCQEEDDDEMTYGQRLKKLNKDGRMYFSVVFRSSRNYYTIYPPQGPSTLYEFALSGEYETITRVHPILCIHSFLNTIDDGVSGARFEKHKNGKDKK